MDKLLSWYEKNKTQLMLNQSKFIDYEEYKEILFITSFLDEAYENIFLSQRIWHIKENIFSLMKCCICNKILIYTSKHKYTSTCSKNCTKKLLKSKNYTGEYSKTDEFKEKFKHTCIERFGVDNYSKTVDFKEKLKSTSIRKFGVENYSQTEEQKSKSKSKCLEKYGMEFYQQTDEYKDRRKATCIEKYGVDSTSELMDNKAKLYLQENNYNIISEHGNGNQKYFIVLCPKCGVESNISYNSILKKISRNINICTICNPTPISFSYSEKELVDFISSIYKGEIIENNKKLINPYEIDIYIPELKLAIEYNGLYWHSDKMIPDSRHKTKTNLCNEKGIRLIHIFEDNWLYKQEIIKSIIQTIIFSESNTKVFARKCEIEKVDLKNTNKFLIENHINGIVMTQSICYGLYYNNELVSLMSFRKNKDKIELQRYAIKLNTTIVGGAEKLLKYFIKNNKFQTIITYCDISLFTGKIYERLGFKKTRRNKPNYQFVDKHEIIRISKQSIRKYRTDYKRENDTMPRIYNCGIDVYEFNK